jgi:hypothetical protein
MFENDRARAERCLELAREAQTAEEWLRWLNQADFWFRVSEKAGREREGPKALPEWVSALRAMRH